MVAGDMRDFIVKGEASLALQEQVKHTITDIVSKDFGFYFDTHYCMGGKIQFLDINHQCFTSAVATLEFVHSSDGEKLNVVYTNFYEETVEDILNKTGLPHTASQLGNLMQMLFELENACGN